MAAPKWSRNFKERSSLRRTQKRTIMDLPSELLLKIFVFLPNIEIVRNIRPVCRRFKELSSPALWKSIEVTSNVPREVLGQWLHSSKYLRSFSATGRNDANFIASEISSNCKQLESINFQNCWGSKGNILLYSTPLCNLITRCKKLKNINLTQCRFLSCKFFHLLTKSQKNGPTMRTCNYTGPLMPKQMKALFESLKGKELQDSAVIGNVNLNTHIRLSDIMKKIKAQTLNQEEQEVLTNVWENLSLGVRDQGSEHMDVDA